METTLNDDGTLASYTGPDGNVWNIYTSEVLFATPPAYYFEIYAAEQFEGAFDFDNHYGLIETYDEEWNWFYYYDSTGEICDLQTEFDTDGNIVGWNVLDTFGACGQVADGWTYAGIYLDDEGNLSSFDAEGGETWLFYTYDDIFNSQPEVEDYYFEIYGAEPHEGEFDYDNTYGLFETYTSSLSWFYFYDSEGAICDL